MSELVHVCAKLDKKTKELFLQLCESEAIDISQALRELIAEALARGYINKERKERLEKIRGGSNA